MKECILKTRKNGTSIIVRDVQFILLETLEDIDVLRKKHNIRYWLIDGNALGAVRHKGFIPWDGDTDIGMPREDYEKFQRMVHELGDAYTAQCSETHREYNALVPPMKVRKEGTHRVEYNALLKNKCRDSDGLFIDIFVLDHASENKAKGSIQRVRNGILTVLIVFFGNLHYNPLLLKRRPVCNVKKYGQINENTVWTSYGLTWTFNSSFHPVVHSLESVFPIQYMEFKDTTPPVPKHPKDMLDIEVSTQHMSYPPLKDQAPKHIKDIELQASLIDDIRWKTEEYLWHMHLGKESTGYIGKSQYR